MRSSKCWKITVISSSLFFSLSLFTGNCCIELFVHIFPCMSWNPFLFVVLNRYNPSGDHDFHFYVLQSKFSFSSRNEWFIEINRFFLVFLDSRLPASIHSFTAFKVFLLPFYFSCSFQQFFYCSFHKVWSLHMISLQRNDSITTVKTIKI